MDSKTKYPFLISLLIVAILLIAFGLQVYMDLKPRLIDSSEIKVTEEKGDKENEKILTVTVDDNRVVFYSFDGGKNFQIENTYSVSENKQIEIVLKDNEKRRVGSLKYRVKVVEDKGPTIEINLPDKIYVGDSIDLSKYATALDSNKLVCDITVQPQQLDTSSKGLKKVTYTAMDVNNLKSSVTIEVEVLEKYTYVPSEKPKEENTKKTYYRYRTKTTSKYECNYFECDYLDENDSTNPIYEFTKDSFCCVGDDCLKTNPTIDTFELCLDDNCEKGVNFTNRYDTIGNSCYDKKYLYVENDGVKELKTECEHDEINISGICHMIDTYGHLVCPEGYAKGDDKCYKLIKKTCNKTCNTETWSSWSNWSTTKVLDDENTQVQTKEE